MTTERRYRCNLCFDEITDGQGVGVQWKTSNAIDFTALGASDNHVCQECLDALEVAQAATREIARKRSTAA